MKRIFTTVFLSVLSVIVYSQTYSSFKVFKDMPLDTFWNGSDLSGGFTDGILGFPTVYDTVWNYWASGWAVSTMRDDSTAGSTNLYSVKTNARIDESPYAIGQNYTSVATEEDESVLFEGMYVTNTTYAYFSMKDGDAFAKKFGGDTGSDPDFFKLRIYAMVDGAIDSTNFVDFYLADFRFDNDSLDYIVDDWWYVDLSPLGFVDGLYFELSSSDIGTWGMNTPAFFAVDKIKYSYRSEDDEYHSSFESKQLPLDSFWNGKDLSGSFNDGAFEFPCVYDTSYGGYWASGFALSTMRDDVNGGADNLYSAIAGGAFDGITYAIGQNHAKFEPAFVCAYPIIKRIRITNTSYAFYSMKNGDAFAKKFGGETGDDPDFFKLRIYPISFVSSGIDSSRFYDVYLADFRFDDNNKDYILDDWLEINIDSIFDFVVTGLAFELFSSDEGQWGINTPAFFAIDRIENDIKTGTVEFDEAISADIYPNPASQFVNVSISHNDSKLNYQLMDISGTIMSKGHIKKAKKINLSGLKPGTYFISISDGKHQTVKKVIKI